MVSREEGVLDGKQDFRKYEMGKGRNIGGASVFYFVRAENILKHVSVCLQPLSKLFHENSEL